MFRLITLQFLLVLTISSMAQNVQLQNPIDKIAFNKHMFTSTRKLGALEYTIDTLKFDTAKVLIARIDPNLLGKMSAKGGKKAIVANALIQLQEYLDDNLKSVLAKHSITHRDDITDKVKDIKFFEPDYNLSIYKEEILFYQNL